MDHDRGDCPQRINLTISADSALLQLLNAIHMDLQGTNNAHALALKAKAISAHLTAVTAQLQNLTKPTPGE